MPIPFQQILARPWRVSVLALSLTALGGAWLPSLAVDNGLTAWLPVDRPALEDWRRFEARFGQDSLVAAMARDRQAARDESGAAWVALARELRDDPVVRQVILPPFAPEPLAAPTGNGAFQPPVAHFLRSEDGSRAGLVIVLDGSRSSAERMAALDRLERVLLNHRESLGPFELAGAEAVTRELDRGSRDSLRRLAPAVVLVMALILLAATREWRAVVAGLAVILMASIWTFGLLAAAGRTLNLVVAVVPAVLAVVTIMTAMHVVAAFQAGSPEGGIPAALAADDQAQRRKWWEQALRATVLPSSLSTFTTAAGFASLAGSAIPPVRDLGVFAAVGVVSTLVLCFTWFPAVLAASPSVRPVARADRWWTLDRADSLARFMHRHARAVLTIAVLLAVLSLAGFRRLVIESDILSFFPAGHPLPRAYAAIDESLIGLTPLEVVIEGPPELLLSDPAMERFREFAAFAQNREPLVRQVLSPLLEPFRRGEPELVFSAEELREVSQEELPPGVERFLWRAPRSASTQAASSETIALRTTILVSTRSSNAVAALTERLRRRLESALGPGIQGTITGSAALLVEGQVLLLETQLSSFGSAFVLIGAVMLISFRSIRLAMVAAVPNLLPIAYTLGFMGWGQIPLNTATVTVAGIALGLVVDDTIHFLHHWNQRRRQGVPRLTAMAQTLHEVGRPAVGGSLAVAGGFAIFGFASFRPTFYFGVLLASAALAALLCELAILPALLTGREPAGR